MKAIVEKAWNHVLVDEKEASSLAKIGLDTPFYDIWGG
jgi:hypothetical protein